MNNRSVFLTLVLALALTGCDSETVQVSSVGEDIGSQNNNQNNNQDNTDSDNNNNDSTDNDSSTDSNNNNTGGDGMLSDPDKLMSLVGLLKVEAVNTDSDFSRGIFTEMETALPAQEILEFFVPATDFCEVTRYNAAFPPGNAFKIYDQQPTLISAGSAITLTSNAGTYATLERQIVQGTGLIYKSNTDLDVSIPSGLVLDVPGEVFPGFSNVALSSVPALSISSPSGNQQITDTTEFVWTGNADPLSVFEIYAGYTSPETNQVIEIGCTVIDDGQFAFPQSIRDELGAGYTADWSAYLRVVYDIAETDDALMFVANSVVR